MSFSNNRLFLIFIIITAITAWFSIGFYQVDEHFQILEFAGYKAGWFSSRYLPWEFRSQMRSSIEPYIVVLLIKGLRLIHVDNPFFVALLMRCITTAMCITCFLLWRNKIKESAISAQLKWYDAALLLWFLPYVCVRFSSEIWGGCLVFISLALLYGRKDPPVRVFFLAGCLASLAFFIRFQTAFLIAGFLFYRIFISRIRLRDFLSYSAGFILIAAVNICLDSLFYHQWCLTPWNYFLENIIYGRAASFGIEPFYYYFYMPINHAGPLVGVGIMAVVITYLVRRIKDEISIGILFFLVAHMITGHKEVRFLYPILFVLPYLFVFFMEWIQQFPFTKSSFFRILIGLLVISNLMMLAAVTIKPADSQVALQQFLYRAIGNDRTTVIYEGHNPFSRAYLPMNFYKNKNMTLLSLDNLSEDPLEATDEKILVVSNIEASSPLKDEKNFRLIYQNVPAWLMKFDFNGWVSRTWVFRVYEMKVKRGDRITPRSIRSQKE